LTSETSSQRPRSVASIPSRLVDDRYEALRATARTRDFERYEGVHVRTGAPVLLEVARSPVGAAQHARLRRLLPTVRHPRIERLRDAGEDPDGRSVLVFDPRRGEPLDALLHLSRRLPALRAVHIAHQLLGALDLMHGLGLVHGGLRPECVLVDAAPGFEDHVTLLGFGAEELPLDVRYAPPELLRGGPRDEAADLYAVGAMLYEMVSGDPPYEKATARVHGRHVPLRRRVPTCLRLASLVEDALAGDPARRPPSAAAFASRLDALELSTLARCSVGTFEPRSTEVRLASLPDAVPPGPLQMLWATQEPSIWVLTGDPALDRQDVRDMLGRLPLEAEVTFLDADERAARMARIEAGAEPPPWALVFGDLHVLLGDPLLAGLAGRVAELSRIIVSTHENVELLQASINACGLDCCLTLPLREDALGDALRRMLERTRSLRFHYDGLRLALRDAQEDAVRASRPR
jgi:hypothetical protein